MLNEPQFADILSHFYLEVIHIFKTIIRIFTAPLRFLTYFWQAGRFSWEADVLVGMFSYPLLCICFPGDRKVASDRCQSRIWCLQLVSSPSLHTGRDRGLLCVVKRDWVGGRAMWSGKHNQEKKSSHTFAHLVNFSKIVWAYNLVILTIE